ncbi:Outer membrane receptor proteins, mostly Fe transport [Rhizobiales bacterium GAS191]|nr:Outer membrane receptor proteins, mostly Fe transport [Rhizobiales bacterium GAS191]
MPSSICVAARASFAVLSIGVFAYAIPATAETPAPPPGTDGAATARPASAARPTRGVVSEAGANEELDITVTAARLDKARNQISTSVGASTYEINRQAIETQPLGNNAALSQTLLQAPGVAQDSFGQLHVRGDHANLQYRINGIIIPETISGFSQLFDTRFARRIDLLTGALPAQYGYRTAGVVEIETKSGSLDPGGEISLYGGQRQTLFPSVTYGGSTGAVDYFVSGSYLQNNIGIENPTRSLNPVKDFTEQGRGFLYLSSLIDANTRLSFISGTAVSQFRFPNNPGQMPSFTAYGVSDFNSAGLREQQLEESNFNIVSLQKSIGNLDMQVAYFNRYSLTHFFPDPVGDIVFNGVASNVRRENFANGVQGDLSYKINDQHTLRAGAFGDVERARSGTLSTVLPLDDSGNPVDAPFTIPDKSRKTGYLLGAYAQDEWRISDRLTVNYGARFDQIYQYLDKHQLSPRVNLVYKPLEGTTLHAGYARYFTPAPLELIAPTAIGKFVNTSAAPNSLIDNVVKPERANYFDAGIIQKIGPDLQIGLDAYYKRANDLIDEGQFGAALIFSPFNYQHAKIYGAELTASYQIDNLTLYGNLAYSRAQGKNIISSQFFIKPDVLTYSMSNYIYLDHDQRFTISGGASYRWGDTLFTTDVISGSGLRKGFANTERGPNYVQVNAGLKHEFNAPGMGKVTARIDMINLTDRKYGLRDGSGVGVGAPQFGPRRTLLAGISKSF